jgi:serine/threonine protein kinase
VDSHNWQQVRALFEQALAASPDERDAVLADASGRDPALLQRVRALLLSHEQASSFLEQPPSVAGVDAPRLPDLAGTQLGPYSLESRIGAGGMGQVYRARDMRLRRIVAVKVL